MKTLTTGYTAVYNVSIFRSISALYHNTLNNYWVIYGVISNSGITRDTSCQCLPNVAYFQTLHRSHQWLRKNIILYKHFPHTHVQNTYTEIAQIQQEEYKVFTRTKVRPYLTSCDHPAAL